MTSGGALVIWGTESVPAVCCWAPLCCWDSVPVGSGWGSVVSGCAWVPESRA